MCDRRIWLEICVPFFPFLFLKSEHIRNLIKFEFCSNSKFVRIQIFCLDQNLFKSNFVQI
jgi:hypothetical protein